MQIITSKYTISTEDELVILVFKNDDELSSFISSVIKTPVRSGLRVLAISPKQLNPLQEKLLNIIQGLDGFAGKEHEDIKKYYMKGDEKIFV